MAESRIQEADVTTHSLTITPPVMGMTSKQPLSNMDPAYSPELENFFPNGQTVDLRNGNTRHVSTAGNSTIQSLYEYVRESGTRYLIAAGQNGTGKVYNVTSAGVATDITGAAASSTTPISAVNFQDRLYLKWQEASNNIYYWQAGAAIVAAGFTGGPAGGLCHITSYKSRLYFSEYAAASVFYTVPFAATLGLTEFDVSSLFRWGGAIAFIGSTSFAGNNIEEGFVIISEMGEILLYTGDYPGAANWQLTGRYYTTGLATGSSGTLNQPCFYWGQDIILITRQGVVALSDIINAGVRGQYQYLSDEVNTLMIEDIKNALSFIGYGINGLVYPKGNYLLVNIPFAGSSNDQYVQWVMNLQTRAWTKFTGQKAYCWSLFDNNLYFGSSDAAVMRADNGYVDTNPATGASQSRTIKLRHAYNYFGDPEHTKSFISCIPTLYQSEGLDLKIDADVDYANTAAVSTVTNTADTSYKIYQPICGLKGIGTACSIRIDGTVTTKRMSLQATKVMWKGGSIGK